MKRRIKTLAMMLIATLAMASLTACSTPSASAPIDDEISATAGNDVETGDTETPSPTEEPTSTPEPTETPTPTPEAHKHSYEVVEGSAVVAKCETAGKEADQACECGEVLEGKELSATGHNYETDASSAKDATCEADGKEADETCTLCGNTISGKVISATGHSYGSYVYNNDATTEKDGTETATCSVCGKTKTRTKEGTKISYDGYDDYGNGYVIGSDGYKYFNCNCPYPLYVLNDNGSNYLYWYSLGFDTSSGLAQTARSILRERYPNSTLASGAKNGPCEGIYLDGTLFLYEAYPIN